MVQHRLRRNLLLAALFALVGSAGACVTEAPEDEPFQVGYRAGTQEDGYFSNGERGNIQISEVNWAGSVRGTFGNSTYDPDDIFIELRNENSRPLHLTNWQITIEHGTGNVPLDDARSDAAGRSRVTYRIPRRENGQRVETNEYVVIAAKRDGAFGDADYFIEDLVIPRGRFEINLRDIDDRLMGDAQDLSEEIFAGGYDGVSVRSMERVQLIFSNQGGRETSWHAYGYNYWDDLHDTLTQGVADDYRELTYASPGQPNSIDYSGNSASGSFE